MYSVSPVQGSVGESTINCGSSGRRPMRDPKEMPELLKVPHPVRIAPRTNSVRRRALQPITCAARMATSTVGVEGAGKLLTNCTRVKARLCLHTTKCSCPIGRGMYQVDDCLDETITGSDSVSFSHVSALGAEDSGKSGSRSGSPTFFLRA